MTTPDSLEKNIEIMLGRLNGIHASLLIIARELPSGTAARCVQEAKIAMPKLEADLIASPLSEASVEEMQRVFLQVLHALECAAKEAH